MTSSLISPHLLDEARVAFLLGPVSINVASCSADLVPSVSRAYGCRVSLDPPRVTVFLPVTRAHALLRDVRAGGAVAVTFSRPKTHQTIQLKGPNGEVAPLRPGDRNLITAHDEAFTREICALGYPESFARSMMLPVTEDVLSLSFTPVEAFEQTPGAAAGQRLESGS